VEKLFHVTTCEALDAIFAQGLAANKDGEIYAFVDEVCADDIACWTLKLSTYALIEIDAKGITGTIVQDEHSDACWRQQKVILQKLIRPEFLKLIARQKKRTPHTFAMSFHPRSV
jgi:hypothetical protein